MIDTTHQADTFHQALLQLINSRLQQLPGVPPERVHVERLAPIDKEDCPAITLHMGDARFESLGNDGGDWDLLRTTAAFTVRVHTRGDPHTLLADPLIAQAHTAVMADPRLGGYAMRLRIVSSRPQQAQSDGTAGIYELGYEATLAVSERDLALQPV